MLPRMVTGLLAAAGIVGTASASDQGDQLWASFRAAYPHPLQAVSVSAPDERGGRVMILSEPPSRATLSTMQALSPWLTQAEVKTHKVGADGWAKDIVFHLPHIAETELREVVTAIHQLWYGTQYGSYMLPLPADTTSLAVPHNLDVRMTGAQLANLIESARFDPVGGGDSADLAGLLASQGAPVFMSHDPGLVVWNLPRGKDINRFRVEARQFAVDSDLVLGAYASATRVLIVGRERVVPVDVLPPLRPDTIFMLAASHEGELGQSFERTAPLAGKNMWGIDWAPVYLSLELVDQEMGWLLNAADKVLKAQSNHGAVTYSQFRVPAPQRWMFDRPMHEEFKVGRILFNFNTQGASSILTMPVGGIQARVLTLARTGSLPVTYGEAGAEVASAATHAWDVFASNSEPLLTRVTQHVALYQAFRAFNVKAAASAPAMQNTAALDGLGDRAGKAFTALRARESEISEQVGQGPLKNLCQSMFSYLNKNASTDIAAKALGRALVQRQRLGDDDPVSKAAREFYSSNWRELFDAFVDDLVDEASLTFCKNSAMRATAGWIRTESYVCSRFSARQTLTGGHNVDPRSIEVEVSAKNGVPGLPRLDSDTSRLKVWIADADKASEAHIRDAVKAIISRVERGEKVTHLEATLALAGATRITVPTVSKAKLLGVSLERAARGFSEALVPRLRAEAELNQLEGDGVYISYAADEFRILDGRTGEIKVTPTVDEAASVTAKAVLAGRDPWVCIDGLDAATASRFMGTVERTVRSSGLPKEVRHCATAARLVINSEITTKRIQRPELKDGCVTFEIRPQSKVKSRIQWIATIVAEVSGTVAAEVETAVNSALKTFVGSEPQLQGFVTDLEVKVNSALKARNLPAKINVKQMMDKKVSVRDIEPWRASGEQPIHAIS